MEVIHVNGVTSKNHQGSVLDLFFCNTSVHHLGKEYEHASELCQQQSSEEYRYIYKKHPEWSTLKTGGNGGR